MGAIFLLDTLSTLEGAVAVLYVFAVLLVARTHERNDIVAVAAASVVLTLVGYGVGHGLAHAGAPTVRAFVSLSAIGIAAIFALQNQSATHALVQSEKRYRRMFDATRIGVIEQDWTELHEEIRSLRILDRNDQQAHLRSNPQLLERARTLIRIKDVNPAFAAMYSGDASRPQSIRVEDVLGADDRTLPEAVLAFIRGDSFYEGETEIVRRDGERVPVLFAITFSSDEDRKDSVLVFLIDATDRKRHQDELLLAQTELAHAARVATLGELTASIAHEVNQPLMAVVTDGQAAMRWLRRDRPDGAEVEAALARIICEGQRAADIVQRVRDFLAKAAPPLEELSTADIVRDAARLIEHELTHGRIELSMDIEARLPTVRGDRVQLQQLLINLMMNASQAMRAQSDKRLLNVRVGRVSSGDVEIAIRDSGPGIAKDHLDRIFDPFFTTKPQGMGMGLSICRSIAEAHHGELSASSLPDSGAIFRLTLPAAARA